MRVFRNSRNWAILLLLAEWWAGHVFANAGPTSAAAAEQPAQWKDPAQTPQVRALELVRQLSLEEKASQIMANAPAIPRLGIPAYSHRNECLHGVVSSEAATIFPQAIGMASTWDLPLIRHEAEIISTEGRAIYNDYIAKHNGDSGEHVGVNFYSPNINILRDPRWGRGQETYGEDPFLTGQIAVAFIGGLQGEDPKYLKAVACAKHFAVHSGPEKLRHTFDARPSDRDLYETYLPAFEAAVREAHVASVMGAYSSLNGVPCCADPFLLTDLLRGQWGFDGVIFSDGGAIGDIWGQHKFIAGPTESAVAAVKAGCDVSSGGMGRAPNPRTDNADRINALLRGGSAFSVLPAAVKQGLITEREVDQAVTRELTMRFRLGLFDPPELVPFSSIKIDQVDTPDHRALALKVAQESIVLLRNDGILPIDRSKVHRLAVIGPNADSAAMQNGNYSSRPSHSATILDGIRQIAGADLKVTYVAGCPAALRADKSNQPTEQDTAEAVAAAKDSDMVIFVSGIDATLEKEQSGPRETVYEGFDRGDRTRIELPDIQEQLLRNLISAGKPIVLVNCSGSAMAIPWEAEHLPAIVQAWYPGEEGGQAVAQALFGQINPAGRLPITFYSSTADLPPFEDYSMSNRTYRYFQGKPLFAFGHGLSYTQFVYGAAKASSSSITDDGTISLSFTLANKGPRDGEEVSQVYFRPVRATPADPRLTLCGFGRFSLAHSLTTTVTLEIPAQRFRRWDSAQMRYVVAPGDYELLIGGSSDDIHLHTIVTVKGRGP